MEYKQLSEYERFRIAHLQAAGASQRQIAAALDRAPSTVARELKRNGTPAGRYAPDYAHLAARSRRWRGARLERDAALRDRVLAGFARRWSPAADRGAVGPGRGSPGALPREHLPVRLPAASAGQGLPVVPLPPPGQDQTGLAGSGAQQPRPLHRPPHPYPPAAVGGGYRETFGHWEADLMSFGRSGPVVLALHERASRLLLAVRQGSKGADATAATLERLLA